MNFTKAAIRILKDNTNSPLSAKEIWAQIEKRGIIESKGKTPWATLNTILSRKSKNNNFKKDDGNYLFEIVSDKPRKYQLIDYKKPKKLIKVKNYSELRRLWMQFNSKLGRVRRIDDINDSCYVHDNQLLASKKVIFYFWLNSKGYSYKRWVMLMAQMQSGKSGCFFNVPYIIKNSPSLIEDLGIDASGGTINSYLLTGMNDRELVEQFESDYIGYVGSDMLKNVLKNSEMAKICKNEKKNKIGNLSSISVNKMKRNSLIMIDESHYGSNKDSKLDDFLKLILSIKASGDEQLLIDNNIYVISISATPMVEYAADKLLDENNKDVVNIKKGGSYHGVKDFMKDGKIHQSFNLNKSVDKLLDKIISLDKEGYIMVRCTESKQSNIIQYMEDNNLTKEISYIRYDNLTKKTILNGVSINQLLEIRPSKLSKKSNIRFRKGKHKNKVIVFIKGMFRAGKRLETQNIIMTHDTMISKSDTTVQSLLGRCCGYNKNKDIDIYCDLNSATEYVDWVDSGYKLDKTPNVTGININGEKNIRDNTTFYFDIYPEDFDLSSSEFINKYKEEIGDVKGRRVSFLNADSEGVKKRQWYSKHAVSDIKNIKLGEKLLIVIKNRSDLQCKITLTDIIKQEEGVIIKENKMYID